MLETAKILILLGALLLLGLLTEAISRRIRLPRVTLLLIFGFVIGLVLTGMALARSEETTNKEAP